MNYLNRLAIKHGMQLVLKVTAAMARSRTLGPSTPTFMAWLARRKPAPSVPSPSAKTASRGNIASHSPQLLAAAWQAGFASKKQVPIVAWDTESAYGQIHTPCPLRGTGDLRACWRMMAYDREIVGRAGGHFAVLRSQAQAGVTHCDVVISRVPQLQRDIYQAKPHADAMGA